MSCNKKVRLLFITYTHSNGGGAEAVLTTFVNNLSAEKYDISIFEIVNFNVKKEPINDSVRFIGSLYQISDSRSMRRTWDYVLEQHPEIIRSIKGLDADVVITWNYQMPSFVLPAFTDKKTIAWFHGAIDDLDLSAEPAVRIFPYYNTLQKHVWHNAGKIITISNRSLQSLKKVFPEYAGKASIIYNGSQSELIRSKAAAAIDFDVNHYPFPFLICIGRLDKNKNFSLVIKAVALLNKRTVPCGVLLIGDGQQKAALKSLVQNEGLADKVFFLGYQKNPLPYLKQAKILCAASFAEGFPTVVVEAMTLGKPFVTTPVAGASEELANGGLCGLVADWTVEDYADKIQRLLCNEQLYTAMSHQCLERVKLFSAARMVEHFEKILTALPESADICHNSITCQQAEQLFKTYYKYSFFSYRLNISKAVYAFKNAPDSVRLLKLAYRLGEYFIHLLSTPIRMVVPSRLCRNTPYPD